MAAEKAETVIEPQMRYELGTGGSDEPDVLLIIDRQKRVIVARSTSFANLKGWLQELVDAANRGAAGPASL